MLLQFLNLIRNNPMPLQPPVDSMEGMCTELEKAAIEQRTNASIIGGPGKVKQQLLQFIERTKADEIIVNAQIYDHQARLRSYEVVAEIVKHS